MNRTEIIIIVILVVIILLLIFLPGKAKADIPLVIEPSYGGDITPPSSLPAEYNIVPTTAQKIEVINPGGTYAFDFGPEGCMTERKGFVAIGTIMPILEVKTNFSKCIEPNTMTLVRTAEGWFSLNPAVIKII